MTVIRVDPPRLHLSADALDRISSELTSVGEMAGRSLSGAPSYDGDFGPRLEAIAAELRARLQSEESRLSDHSRRLRATAEAFQAADQQCAIGLTGLGNGLAALPSLSALAPPPMMSWGQLAQLLGLEEPDDPECPPWWARLFPPIYLMWSILCQVQTQEGVALSQTPTPTATLPPSGQQTPAPTGTPSPTVTPSPSPTTPPLPLVYVVATAGLNLRDAAGLQSNVLVLLPYRSELSQTGDETIADDLGWIPVQTQDGQAGWVAVDFVGDALPPATALDHAPLAVDGLVISGNEHAAEVYKEQDGQQVLIGLHPGIDISGTDTSIRANIEGNVYFYQDDANPGLLAYDPEDPVANDDLTGFGNFVLLESNIDGETYYQVYAHMDSFSADIGQGDLVAEGTFLGIMGSTGKSTGPHVHWEIRREAAVTIDADGVHGFSTFYPADETELDDLFVDPDDFAQWIDEQPAP